MAETTKTTSTRGRKPKTVVEDTKKETEIKDSKPSQDDIIATLMAQIAEQNKMMAELQKQVEASKNQQPIIIQQDAGFSGKKIKCMSLMHNPINISTEPNGMGKIYTFEKYGDVRMVKFDDLNDIVSSYPYTMENGLVYICDRDVVKLFDLEEEYSKIYNKDMMDKIMYLREDSDVDLFIGMEENLRQSTAIEIARLLNANESMDYNYLRRIKNECNIDIEKIANDIAEEQKKSNE